MSKYSRQTLIAGNWKMHKSMSEAAEFTQRLFEALKSRVEHTGQLPEVALCPPYTALLAVQETLVRMNAPFRAAAQNMDSHDQGAYTGEISPLMLKELKVDMVVLGHSERRQYFNETDQTVADKVQAAIKHDMEPIICVGETLEEREAGQADAVIRRQVEAAISKIEPSVYHAINFAYEPVWAIGTGKTCDTPEANRVCGLIRKILDEKGSGTGTRILYGGSVKPNNARELLDQPEIDGALVGGASLDVVSFAQIIEACTHVPSV